MVVDTTIDDRCQLSHVRIQVLSGRLLSQKNVIINRVLLLLVY